MKAFELEDPFSLVGVGLQADPDDEALAEMAWAIVEEYARMGWSGDQIRRLFRSPFFQLAHRIAQVKGEAFVERLAREADRIRSEAAASVRATA